MAAKRAKQTARKKAAMPGLQEHYGSFRWRRMVDGKRVIVALHAKTEAEAVKEVLLLQARPQSKLLGEWSESVIAYLAAWHKGRPLSSSTIDSRGAVLHAVGRDLELRTPLSLTPAVADRWLSLLQHRVKAAEISQSTLAHYIRDVRAFCKWCCAAGRMVKDPTQGFQVGLPQAKYRKTFLFPEQIAKLLAAARTEGDREMEFILALPSECAMRRGEADACRPEWFDLRQKLVRIPAEDEIDSQSGRVFKRKGREERRREAIVPLSDVMLELIEHHKLPSPFVIRPEKGWGRNRYRFEFKKRYKAFMLRHGHPGVTYHDLRRSFASNKVSAGAPMEKVANWMAIELKTAWDRYARFIPSDPSINLGSSIAVASAPPVAAALPSPAPAETSLEGRLARIEGLLAKGVISADERAVLRAKVLAEAV